MSDRPNIGSVEGSAQYSPMTLVMRYLNDHGQQPTADNIRRALNENARNPGTIPGLRNMEAEDSNPAPSTRVGNRGGGPSAPSGATPEQRQANADATGGSFDSGAGSPTTSAAPAPAATTTATGGSPSAGEIATAVALGGLLPAVLMRNRGGAMPGETVPVQDPRALFRPPVDPNAPPATPGAGQPPLVENAPTPMDTALNRVVETPNYVEGVPPVSPEAQGNYRPGPSTPVPPEPVPAGEGNIPFNRQPGEVKQPPTAAETADLRGRLRGAQRWFGKAPRATRF